MTTDNKTLADAQPGGRVRLGDGNDALAASLRQIADAQYTRRQRFNGRLPAAAQEVIRMAAAALSAQPSPGGQGDALTALAGSWRVCADEHDENAHEADSIGDMTATVQYLETRSEVLRQLAAELESALAAHQPVGEPFAYGSSAGHQPIPASVYYPDNAACRELYDIPLYTSPQQSAQAVDLGPDPMFYIQDTRQFVGNCPVWWGPGGGGYVTRLDEAGRYTEQEAVKQNRCRDTDIPWPCAEIEAIARRTVDFQHMRPRAERLAELALIDSLAVGK